MNVEIIHLKLQHSWEILEIVDNEIMYTVSNFVLKQDKVNSMDVYIIFNFNLLLF